MQNETDLKLFRYYFRVTRIRGFDMILEKALLASLFIPLAAGKWGNYIGFSSKGPFLEDILIFFAGFCIFFRKPELLLDRPLILLAIFNFLLCQMIRNQEYAVGTKLRDLIPFIYFLLFPALAYLTNSIGLKRIIIVVRTATFFHLIWTSAVTAGIVVPFQAPFPFMIPIFTTRWDQSGFVFAIGIGAWSRFPTMKLQQNLLIRLGFLVMAISQGSRAGLLAVFVSILWVAFRNYHENDSTFEARRDLFFPFVFLSLLGIIFFSPYLTKVLPENSSLGRIGLVNISEQANANADGTALGRKIAQSKLLEWVKDKERLTLGVGPGVEMVYESGAFSHLSGAIEVRSPHSWLYGSLARFGIVGTIFWYVMLITVVRLNSFKWRRPESLWILVIMVTSFFGVIIESPFGAIPLAIFAASLGYRERS